jgi:hypothetical protein
MSDRRSGENDLAPTHTDCHWLYPVHIHYQRIESAEFAPKLNLGGIGLGGSKVRERDL